MTNDEAKSAEKPDHREAVSDLQALPKDDLHGRTVLGTLHRTDEDYLRWDPFSADRDVEIRARTVKLVTTRKSQQCHGVDARRMHVIPPGTRARYEHALVEGQWGSYYMCLACMDEWLKEICV